MFILIIIFFIIIFIYNSFIKSVNGSEENLSITIPSGFTSREIASELKSNSLIRSKIAFLIIFKFNEINIQSGVYFFDGDENLFEIFDVLKKPSGNIGDVLVAFPEGKNIKQYSEIIENNTNCTSEDFISAVNDRTFIKSLIDKYWFLSDTILDEDIYYPLEGYLVANTYMLNVDYDPEKIITIILDQTDKVLNKYKDDISDVHKMLTISSVVRLEGGNADDLD